MSVYMVDRELPGIEMDQLQRLRRPQSKPVTDLQRKASQCAISEPRSFLVKPTVCVYLKQEVQNMYAK